MKTFLITALMTILTSFVLAYLSFPLQAIVPISLIAGGIAGFKFSR